jgi:hypothetical protein
MPGTYRFCIFALLLAPLGALACGSDSKPPAKTAGRCAEMGAKVGVAGAKTGVTAGVEGVKAAGKAVGGSSKAARRARIASGNRAKQKPSTLRTKVPTTSNRNRKIVLNAADLTPIGCWASRGWAKHGGSKLTLVREARTRQRVVAGSLS